MVVIKCSKGPLAAMSCVIHLVGVYNYINVISGFYYFKYPFVNCDGMAEWCTCQTNNIVIARHMGSNPVRDKPLFL
jgi:hypothetical protein